MEKKNIIEQIKSVFQSEKVEDETLKLEFMDLELTDGRKAMVVPSVEGELNIGDEFSLIDENGDKMDADDGDYETVEGMILVVKDGKIDDIKQVDVEDPVEDAPEQEVAASEEFEDSGVSAYVELPVGVHEIDGKVYTVVEVIEDEGTDNEYKRNMIESIVPKEGDAVAEAMASEEDSVIKAIEEGFSKLNSDIESLRDENKKLTERVNKFAGEPSAKSTETKVTFSENSKEEKLRFFGRR